MNALLLYFAFHFSFIAKKWRLKTLQQHIQNAENELRDIQLKIATSPDEIEAAVAFIEKNQSHSSIEIDRFCSLPTFHYILLYENHILKSVAGFLVDNPIGLHSDPFLHSLKAREKGLRLGEWCGVAHSPAPLATRLYYQLLLNCFAQTLARDFLKLDLIVSVTQETEFFLYQELLCYESVEPSEMEKKLRNRLKSEAQVFSFFSLNKSSRDFSIRPNIQIEHPKSDYFLGSYSFKNAPLFQKLFTNQSVLLRNLSYFDRLLIEKMYTQKSTRNLIPVHGPLWSSRRQHARYPVACPAVLKIRNESHNIEAIAIDASLRGLSLIMKSPVQSHLKMTQSLTLTVQLSPHKSVDLIGEIVWKSHHRSSLGVSLKDPLPSEWTLFIDHLESCFTDSVHKNAA